MRSWFIAAVVAFLLIAGCGLCADKDEPAKEKSIFLKEVPVELVQKIDKHLEQLAKEHPVTEKERAEIETIVKEFCLEWIDPTGPAQARPGHYQQQKSRIRTFGIRAMPTIAKNMLSKDDAIRESAYSMAGTMMGFIGLVEPRSEKAKETGDVLALLAERGLLDSNSDARYQAAGVLYLVGEALWPDIPEEVKTGLERAEKEDPTLKNRQWAHYSRYLLGLTELNPDMVPSKELLK